MTSMQDVRFPDQFNFAQYCLFDRITEGRGSHPAILFGDRQWTYQQVVDRSVIVARFLLSDGLHPEDRVAIVLPDIPPFAWGIFGVLAAGGILVMGNPQSPVVDLAHMLSYVKATTLVTTKDVAIAVGQQTEVHLPHLQRVLLVPDASTNDDPEAAVDVAGVKLGGAICLQTAMALGAGSHASLPITYRDDPCIWLFTSGSTGRPKAAMHTHRDFAFNTEVYAKRTVGYRPDDVTLSVPRLFFGYATGTNLWFPFAVGATVALFSERPTAESIAAAVARYRPTIITNVPTMMGKLLDLDAERTSRGESLLDFSSVRLQLSAGEALPPVLLTRFRQRFPADVYDGIGSAEMFHIYCSNRPGDIRPGSLGRVVDGYQLRILPESAIEPGADSVPTNEIGVLWVKGDSVAMGYYQDRDKSWQTFHGHWCRTGDLFRMDEAGYLYLAGRADDLLKVGGVFVAPLEVEDCLLLHDAVSSVAVIAGMEDGLVKPKAIVCVRPEARQRLRGTGRAELERELKAHVQARLSKHKYPRWIVFVDELPRNDRGKIDRKLLGELAAAGALVEVAL
jgi:benzoate-CoA ligase family protein